MTRRPRPLLLAAATAVSVAACALGGVVLCALYTAVEITGSGKAFMGTRPKCENFNLPDPLIGWKLLPNLRVYSSLPGYESQLLFETDRYGFRNRGPELPPSGAAMVLGDSFAQGYNLDGPETIASRLEALEGRPVYNFGVGGFSTDQEFIVAREALTRFRTDWVVVLFFINDLPFLDKDVAYAKHKPVFERDADGRLRLDRLRLVSVPDFLRKRSLFGKDIVDWPPRTARLPAPGYEEHWPTLFATKFQEHLDRARRLLLRPSTFLELALHWRELDETTPWQLHRDYPGRLPRQTYTDPTVLAQDWDRAFQLFTQLKSLSQKHQARLLVVYLPEFAQLEHSELGFTQPQRDFTRLCSAHAIDCLEPLETFLRENRSGDLYLRDEGHLSPRGADLTARLIKSHIDAHR